jgi:hypothetical protein
MLRSGVCSVEGSFKMFLALNDKDELPKLWLSTANPDPHKSEEEDEGHNEFDLIIMSKRD